MIDPISWIVIGFVIGGAFGYFWDDIKAWASQMLGYILDAINEAIEVTSDGITWLVKEGTHVYKRVEVFVRNIRTGGTRREYRQEEIYRSDIPDDLNAQLDRKMQLKLMQQST